MSASDGDGKGPTFEQLAATLVELGVLNSTLRHRMDVLQAEMDEMTVELAELKAKVRRLEGSE